MQITGLVTWSAHGSSSCCQLLWPDSTSGYLHNLVDTHTVEFKVTMDCFDCCDLSDYYCWYNAVVNRYTKVLAALRVLWILGLNQYRAIMGRITNFIKILPAVNISIGLEPMLHY